MKLRRDWFFLNRLPAPLRRFAEGEQGVTAIEFALVLPIVLLIMLGCFEVPRFVLIYQKIARTSAGVADLVAQADEPIAGNQMQDIFLAGKIMMQPFDVVANGKIIVSSINNPDGDGVELTWQKDNGGQAKDPDTGTDVGSKLGAATDPPAAPTNLPAILTPASNEEVLAAEVYFNYQPVFTSLIYNGSQLYMISYTRPRNKNLLTPTGDAGSES
jgi:Flp pilus assembly protein TadG